MTSIPNPAEGSKKNPTAKNNKSAFRESAHEDVSARGGTETNSKPHAFSKNIAELRHGKRKLGHNAAIILRYLSFLVRQSTNVVNGKKIVRMKLDHITAQYPYMGRSTVDENLLKLRDFGLCEIANLNGELGRAAYDQTRSYHVPRKWMDAAEEDLRYFDPQLAANERLGVPGAVIYSNFCCRIAECEKTNSDNPVQLKPSVLAKLQPFSKPSIKRALKALKDEQFIVPIPGSKYSYTIGPGKSSGSNPDEIGSKADKTGSNPDEIGSNPDDDSSCKIIENELEESSKGEPSASSCACPPDGLNKSSVSPFQGTAGCKCSSAEFPGTDTAVSKQSDHVLTPEQLFANEFTENMEGEASTVHGNWPDIYSFAHLKEINTELRPTAAELERNKASWDKLCREIRTVCAHAINSLDREFVWELYNDPDPENLIPVLLPYYQQSCTTGGIAPNNLAARLIYYAGFECLLGGFLREKQGDFTHSILLLTRTTRHIHLEIDAIAEDVRLQWVKEEFNERRLQFASVDEQKEIERNLSPAEKMRVFRNALNSRNKVGWIFFDQIHRTNVIEICRPALRLVKKFFEQNPDLTPADLLQTFDRAMAEHCSAPTPSDKVRKGVKWHARRSNDLLTFITNLHHVVDQLGMESPVMNYLRDVKKQKLEEQQEFEMAA